MKQNQTYKHDKKEKKMILPVTATTWKPVMTACHDDTAFRRSKVIAHNQHNISNERPLKIKLRLQNQKPNKRIPISIFYHLQPPNKLRRNRRRHNMNRSFKNNNNQAMQENSSS